MPSFGLRQAERIAQARTKLFQDRRAPSNGEAGLTRVVPDSDLLERPLELDRVLGEEPDAALVAGKRVGVREKLVRPLGGGEGFLDEDDEASEVLAPDGNVLGLKGSSIDSVRDAAKRRRSTRPTRSGVGDELGSIEPDIVIVDGNRLGDIHAAMAVR